MSIIVATGVYALLLKFLLKSSPHNVQSNGGGVKGFLNNVKKMHFSCRMASLIVVTLNRQSSERIVAGGESSVGEDGGVDPGQEVGDAGVHVRNVL